MPWEKTLELSQMRHKQNLSHNEQQEKKKAHKSCGDGCPVNSEREREGKFGEGGRSQITKGFGSVKPCFCLVGSHSPVVSRRECVCCLKTDRCHLGQGSFVNGFSRCLLRLYNGERLYIIGE